MRYSINDMRKAVNAVRHHSRIYPGDWGTVILYLLDQASSSIRCDYEDEDCVDGLRKRCYEGLPGDNHLWCGGCLIDYVLKSEDLESKDD